MHGGFMAARKKTNRRKSNVGAKFDPGPVAAPPAPPRSSGGKYLFAVILALVVIALYNHFRVKVDTVKPYKVQQLLMVQGKDIPCGSFTAWGIAPVVGKDEFVISDAQHGRLLYFDFQGKFLRSVCKAGKSRGALELDEPSGMCYDSKGNVYVTDTWGGAIKGFDPKGNEILNLDLVRLGGFYSPRGCGFDGHNFVIADTGTSRIVLVSEDGTQMATWEHGTGPGQFKNPGDAAADSKGNYFVADSGNHRLQWLDSKGKAKKIIKYNSIPIVVCVDKDGRVYVAMSDPGSCVKVYDPELNYLGDLADQKGSYEPFKGVMGIAISPDNVLMITLGDTVTLFKVPPAS